MITEIILKEILDNFAKEGLIFSNEQDFQFELASALLNKSDIVEEIRLEPLTIQMSWDKVKNLAKNNNSLSRTNKEYTDILVKDKDENYTAIELKYKTTNRICYYETKNYGKILTMKQGAYNLGAYDFLKDIKRLEDINKRHFSKNIHIKQSFAIMLTNDRNYRFNDFSKSTIWKNYSLKHGREISPDIKLTFKNGQEKYEIKNRKFCAIQFKNSYSLNWHDYPLDDYKNYKSSNNYSPGFSYIIIPITY